MRSVHGWVGAALIATGMASARADQVLVSETFDTDPIAGSRAIVDGDASRFGFSPGALTAGYDTLRPTTKLLWPLGRTLDQTTGFRYQATFTVHGAGLFADPNGFAQIAFGLLNAQTTGDDRSGNFDFGATTADTFDMVSVDYFPNISIFGGPTLAPVVIEGDDADPHTDAFAGIHFPFAPETGLDEEWPLTLTGVPITAELRYDAVARRVVLTLADADGPLVINAVGAGGALGGYDGDVTTIESVLPAGAEFEVDSFGLMLWYDYFAEYVMDFNTSAVRPRDNPVASVIANVTFDSFEVALVPEPGAAAVLVLSGACALARRRGVRGCGA